MTIVQLRHEAASSFLTTIFQRGRLALLCLFLLLALSADLVLALIAPPPDSPDALFITCWLLSFLPYLAACLLIMTTKAPTGRRQWIELAVIIGGAISLRALLLHIPPNLSHDSWRYLWDARVTLHGYSPYAYAPNDARLIPLRDFIYENSRFRNVPTVYPPAAQAVYLFSYLIAPGNLSVLKGLFLLCDIVSCVALAYLLKQRGNDPARCLIYAWCPLPIIEFAIQGHLDALTIMLMLLTIVCAQSQRPGAPVLTGFLLALATLTKFYPLLLLAVVMRRRDWALLTTCFATLLLAYIPYLILGHGQVLGFLSTYTSEQTYNAGLVPQIISLISHQPSLLDRKLWVNITYLLDLLIVCAVSLLIWRRRLQKRISMEVATLILIGTIFLVSSHIFSWYTTALLPWIAILAGPLWTKERKVSAQGLAVATAWYFTIASISSYFFERDWHLYYILVYGVVVVALSIAALMGSMKIMHRTNVRKKDRSLSTIALIGRIQNYIPSKSLWKRR